jgi:hypothetical protein
MNKFLRYLLVTGVMIALILCVAYIAHAQTIPTSATGNAAIYTYKKELSELSELRLVVSYQKAIMLKAPFDAAAEAYSKLAESERKAAGLPEGTRFEVREDASRPSGWQVLVITPPAKVEPPKGDEPAVKK